MRKLLIVTLAIFILLSMVSGCASVQTTETTQSVPTTKNTDETTQAGTTENQEPAFKIAYMDYPMVMPMMAASKANAQYACKTFGGEAVFVVLNEFSMEGIIDWVEQVIQMGVDAIDICPFTEAPMAKIASLCDEAGVYYIWRHRQIFNEEIKQLCFSSPYFLGWAVENEYEAAFKAVKYMAESGVKNIAMITEDLSDTVAAEREAGSLAAAEMYGVKVLGTVRGLKQGTQVTEAVGSFIASFPELQLVYCTGATTPGLVDGILSASAQAGRDDIKIGSLDFLDGSEQPTKDGTVLVQAGGQHVPNTVFTTLVAIYTLTKGNRLGGGPIKLNIALDLAYGYSDVENYYKYNIGNIPLYTSDELRAILTDDLTAEELMEFVAVYNIKDVAKQHADIEPGSIEGFHNTIFD